MKTKTKLVFVLVMIATLIISLAVYKIQKDDFKDNFSNVELKQSKEFENDLNGILKSYLQSNDYVDKKDIPKCLSEYNAWSAAIPVFLKIYHFEEKIEALLGNGLNPILDKDVSMITIAGMGAFLIGDILEENKDYIDQNKRLFLQPNANSDHLRE